MPCQTRTCAIAGGSEPARIASAIAQQWNDLATRLSHSQVQPRAEPRPSGSEPRRQKPIPKQTFGEDNDSNSPFAQIIGNANPLISSVHKNLALTTGYNFLESKQKKIIEKERKSQCFKPSCAFSRFLRLPRHYGRDALAISALSVRAAEGLCSTPP